MLAQSRQTRNRVYQFADGALFALALAIAYALRDGLARIDILDLWRLEPFSDLLWLPPVVAVLGPVFLSAQKFYTQRRGSAFAAARAALFTAVALIITLYLARAHIARSVVILGCALGGVFAWARAAFTARLAASRLAREQWRERVLWIGAPESNNRHRAALAPDETAHITDLGDFDPRDGGPPERLAAILHERAVGTVVLDHADAGACRPLIERCAREGVSVVIRAGFLPRAAPHVRAPEIDVLGGETVLHFRAHPAPRSHLVIKRAIDIAASAAALVLLSPLFLAIALVIALTSRGPVLFSQTRAGLNGRPFAMHKFRTMRAGAENERDALAAQNEMSGPVFKIADDPRLTPPGGFLRRHGLDELPQLWNVLRGEMSMVGPRPLPLYEVRRFDDDAHRRRQSVRPGLTCLWQTRGRNDIVDFSEWVRLDLAYIDNWSLWLDARILLATVPAVIFGTGGR